MNAGPAETGKPPRRPRPAAAGSSPAAPAAVHQPVLLPEVLDALRVAPGKRYIDATLGGGGHTEAILRLGGPTVGVLAIDADIDALTQARARLRSFADAVVFVHGNFGDLADLVEEQGWTLVDGVLMDLGLSSSQLAAPERGFSFQRPAPLDMRFDVSRGLPASYFVNTLSQRELTQLLREFGEEPRAAAIAATVVRRRPMESTLDLVRAVEAAVSPRREDTHPATRTFQALRIAVNQELDRLEAVLPQAVDVLKPAGRLAVISYHSLEDRIVKQFMAREATGCLCPRTVPVCQCGHVATLKVLTRKPITPSSSEVRENPRSRSAKLRVAERLPGPSASEIVTKASQSRSFRQAQGTAASLRQACPESCRRAQGTPRGERPTSSELPGSAA